MRRCQQVNRSFSFGFQELHHSGDVEQGSVPVALVAGIVRDDRAVGGLQAAVAAARSSFEGGERLAGVIIHLGRLVSSPDAFCAPVPGVLPRDERTA